jgi:hypothetical protein
VYCGQSVRADTSRTPAFGMADIPAVKNHQLCILLIVLRETCAQVPSSSGVLPLTTQAMRDAETWGATAFAGKPNNDKKTEAGLSSTRKRSQRSMMQVLPPVGDNCFLPSQ